MAFSGPSFFLPLCALAAFSALSCQKASVSAAAPSQERWDKEARALVASWDDKALAAQVLLTGIYGDGELSAQSRAALREVPAGGVMLFKYNLGQGAASARRLGDQASRAVRSSLAASGLPDVAPFVAVDHEGGRVHRFGADAAHLPAAAEFGRLGPADAAEACGGVGLRAGRELRALGVNLNLAPVAEAGTGAAAVFLGDRAYASDPKTAAAAASGFVAGMRKASVACVVKHFPGNAAADPHKSAARIEAAGADLDRLLEPFRLVIAQSDPAAVMVSHAVVSAADPKRPATLSPAVLGGLLRGRLGFKGLVVSDDLRMEAIASTGRGPASAAVEAVGAGVDLVMTWTEDLVSVRDALAAAAADGRLDRERLRDAAARVVAVKLRYGLWSPAAAGPSPVPASGAADAKRLKAETEAYLKEWGLR